MKTLEQCQWCHSSVFIANCEHVSNFFLIVDFEELGSYQKTNTIEDKIGYMRYFVVF